MSIFRYRQWHGFGSRLNVGEWDERFEVFSQQVRSQILFSFIIFATNSVASLCFAQTANDGYEFRTTGLYRQVASLQNAVEQRDSSAPVYAYDDTTGKQTCVWGCDQRGETGVARRQEIKVMGRDERNDPSAFLNSQQQVDYSNVGRIECPVSGNETAQTSAWIAFSADTLGTSAHAFVDSETNRKITPSNCQFVMFDASGRELDRIWIRYARSQWDNPAHFGDKSFEFAAVKLERRPRIKITGPAIAEAKNLDNRPIKLVAFHGDVTNTQALRVTRGTLFKMPQDARPTTPNSVDRVSDKSRLFITNYDSNHGSSGGMIIDDATGAIIGVHVGSNENSSGGEFNSRNNYNIGLYLNNVFIDQLKAVAADKTTSGQSI